MELEREAAVGLLELVVSCAVCDAEDVVQRGDLVDVWEAAGPVGESERAQVGEISVTPGPTRWQQGRPTCSKQRSRMG